MLPISLLAGFTACKPSKKAPEEIPNRKWWKEAIVYQIYPRSFKDTDGDGIGDLRGIIEKLDYIKSLGVDAVWLNPIYASPNADNGYDISDYENIMEEFGTMDDFDEMLQGFHDRGIKLVMDLVVNHSSDEHEWFKQSRSSRKNPYRHFYHWWPAEDGPPPFRAGFFDPNGEAWLYDSTTQAYYLHYFGRKQPDLNWENPLVRQEIYDMMTRWFEKGIDGFRMDVIPFISKDTTWPMITAKELEEKHNGDWARYYASGPNLHTYLHEMNQKVLSQYDVMALGEGAGVTLDKALDFVDEEREELHLFFHFDGQSIGYSPEGYRRLDPQGWKLSDFKKVYTRWSDVFADKGWGSIYLGNHDQPRMVSRWGNDSPEFWAASSKMLTTFLLSMRGTPFFYFGDEIGMTNLRLDHMKDYKDIETLSWYEQLLAKGKDPAPYMEDWKITARENGRSPFQWNSSQNAGFTRGVPWLKINDNYKYINAESQEDDPQSILNYFRKMVQIRKTSPILVYGNYQMVQPDHEQVYAYTRKLGDAQMLVVLNFSKDTVNFNMPTNTFQLNPVINNYKKINFTGSTLHLKPYQAAIFASN